MWLLAYRVRTLLEKESPRGNKAYRVNNDRDDFADALDLLAIDPRAYAGHHEHTFLVTHGAAAARPPKGTTTLKIVYVNEPATADA
ncbi:hypothetical protein [Catellatospora sp. NPDC049609]|uniref:hypothetical protein n=1 Tax=Catellatospora sp. NPDC049609 TaxID=3155505 RepID=UPI0034267FCB